jgi:transcriptional regulator with XRE-family HTH domain
VKQTEAVVEALKRALKARGVTYAQVASALGLSQASVKRLFSSGHFTLERFEQVCELAQTSIMELARELEGGKDEVEKLTLAQERSIMSDRRLLLVALCALNHLSLEQITQTYALSKAECIQLLVQLDRIGFLELLPNNHIKLRVTRAFSWLPDGPIQQYFKSRAQQEYFGSTFAGPGELMLVVNGTLSRTSSNTISSRLRRIANEFTDLHHADAHLPLGERRPTTLVLAIRPWELQAFADLKRVRSGTQASGPRARTVRAGEPALSRK